ncbi:MAG: hypothetical protein KDK70_29765 [Myxococcales bacterium]|nr:hypothetical protein [Myxococcales bacterium]
MSRSDVDWRIAYADEQLVAAHLCGLLVLSWRTGAGLEHVKAVADLQSTLVERGYAPLSILNIFSLEKKGGISDELRHEGRRLFERMARHYLAQAYVILGEGFWAAGIRAFLSGFTGRTSRKVETQTFGTVSDAMRWLGQLPGQPPWMRTGDQERVEHVEEVVLTAHSPSLGAPSLRTFAPTRPQRLMGMGGAAGDKGLWTACCGRVHVSYWTEHTNAADVARMHHDIAALASKEGGPVALLLFADPQTPLSQAEARTRTAAMLRELHRVIESVALVTPGSGMWSIVMSSMFRDIDAETTPSARWKTFEELEPAVDWLRERSQQHGRHVPRAKFIRGAIDALRVEAETGGSG